MPTRSGLSIYAFTAPTSGYYSQTVKEIGSYVENLSFGSAAPGGFTLFSALLPLRDARIPRPEFALFSKIAVMSGPVPVWLGEITDPEQGMDETYGEYIRLSALGLGNALRDDPYTLAYVAQTTQQIGKDQLSRRTVSTSAIQTISSDSRYIFPDNPAATFSPVYDNRTMEEIIADICTLAGDYTWGVWAHPLASKIDGAGFRLGVLRIEARDTATTDYSASISERDVIKYGVTPSAERAYNAVYVDYNNGTSGVGTKTYVDPRLDPTTHAQKNAPFRWRKLVRDYTGTSTINGAQAQAIANTYGAEYKDVSNKISFTLRSIRDSNGNPLPLWEVLAARNVFIRDFAPRGNAPLPTAPKAGVNQFWIVNATYREDSSGQQLELECDNFVDRAATRIARLTLAADVKSRTNKTTGFQQAQGAAASGRCSMAETNAGGGLTLWANIQYPVALYQAPTSIAFTAVSVTNLGSPSAANINALGAVAAAITSGAGAARGSWTYTTSGNCIRRIGRKLMDWHCDGCGKEFHGLAISRFVRVETGWGEKPGEVGLAIDCPECAAGEHPFTESFNTALTSADEAPHHYPHRREQARLIRRLMRHGAVGLEVLP